MASLRAQGRSFEIRECRVTPRGPRQFVLARFRDVLTPEVLERAEAEARRPFDRAKLVESALRHGIPVNPHRTDAAARRLLAELRAGSRLEPGMVQLLRAALGGLDAEPLPEHLEDAAEWIGRSAAERGKALRGLLRTASRIRRSCGPKREPEPPPFPRFRSREIAA
ncbi:hypothetical protein MYXO_03873 [Myxococcaceae bacterium]|nr:hypothetical protein MYXO_03873 [Myxococcaceae bacterium]